MFSLQHGAPSFHPCRHSSLQTCLRGPVRKLTGSFVPVVSSELLLYNSEVCSTYGDGVSAQLQQNQLPLVLSPPSVCVSMWLRVRVRACVDRKITVETKAAAATVLWHFLFTDMTAQMPD